LNFKPTRRGIAVATEISAAGHAILFRCQYPEAVRMRVDVMARMRGMDAFAKLWQRRATIKLPDGTICDSPALPDLVQAKKTQRDKDWPMIRRLVAGRPLLTKAIAGDIAALECELVAELQAERETDKLYWLPLRRELEQLRPARLSP
jgi:hypothetical protein